MWVTQLISITLSVVILVVTALFPYFYLRRRVNNAKRSQFSVGLLSLSNCFACGIFLATCFLALIPHTLENERIIRERLFGPHPQKEINDVIPHSHVHNGKEFWEKLLNTNLLILIGFLLIIFVEQVLDKIKTIKRIENEDYL